VSEILNLENVSYSYPGTEKKALEEINLSVIEGEFLALMGENGAGKTTFCKLINGIIPHFYGGQLSGTVVVDGEQTDISSVPHLALKVGMVFDDPDTQIFTSSVRHEVAFGPENLLLPPQEIEQRVAWALGAVGLRGFEKKPPLALSGGEKQRLAIASALAMKGKILVLDEPLCRLDPQGVKQVMSVIKDIREKYQLTIIMATHNSARAAEFANRICILKNGRIAAIDTAKNIFSNYALLEENGIQPPFDMEENEICITKAKKAQKGDTKFSFVPSCDFVVNNIPVIEIRDFSFTYPGGESIRNINLKIEDNDFLAIIGNNGCGKTTLLKNITGLLHPFSGDILVRGKNTKELTVSAISKEIGFVMQNPDNQLFTGSVYDEVAFALKNLSLSKTEIQKKVEDALRAVGLEDEQAFPHALSRADRTKTIIACVLAMGCKIIILDEADIGQDYRGSKKIMDLAKELHQKGYTIIFVTHNMSLVCEYAHRLIMMEKDGIVMDMRRNNLNEK